MSSLAGLWLRLPELAHGLLVSGPLNLNHRLLTFLGDNSDDSTSRNCKSFLALLWVNRKGQLQQRRQRLFLRVIKSIQTIA